MGTTRLTPKFKLDPIHAAPDHRRLENIEAGMIIKDVCREAVISEASH